MNPYISIIVPVYNAQEYINRCIDSILNQEYQNFEVLLIDDGSTDRSPEILDTYAHNDSRIQVFHRANSGVSASRNYALSIAKGAYVQFLDSDDWITPDATKLFVRTVEETSCDMVIADFYRVTGNRLSQKGDIETDEVMDRQEFASHMIENPADFYYGVLWNKFYRRSIIEEHHIRMDTSISWCEDFLFNLEYIRHAHTFCALQAPVYYYVKRKGSLVSQNFGISSTIKMKINVFDYYNQFYKDVYEEEDYEEIRLQVYRFLVSSAKDGTVPPMLLPGSTKLGQERKALPIPTALTVEGEIMENYRFRKLLEYYLETAATTNHLTFEEMYLIFLIHRSGTISNVKELSDLSGIPQFRVSKALQRLEKKKLIEIRAKKRNMLNLTLLSDADAILNDLETAHTDFNATRFKDFTKEEQELYLSLSNRMDENIQEALWKLY